MALATKIFSFCFQDEIIGQVNNCSPEEIEYYKSKEPNKPDMKYGPPCDIWAFGVIAFQLLSAGEHPFDNDGDEDLTMYNIQQYKVSFLLSIHFLAHY